MRQRVEPMQDLVATERARAAVIEFRSISRGLHDSGEDVVLLDIRERDEFAMASIPNEIPVNR